MTIPLRLHPFVQVLEIPLQDAIDRGWVDGPRMLVSGHALSITGGHCDVTGFAPGVKELDYRSGIADGVDEVVKAVRYQIKHGATVIKICATAGVLSFEGPVGTQQYTFEELKAAADEAAKQAVAKAEAAKTATAQAEAANAAAEKAPEEKAPVEKAPEPPKPEAPQP